MSIKPYYRDDYVTVYHGDSTKILGEVLSEQPDIIVTDPPYGMSFESGHRRTKSFGKIHGDDQFPVAMVNDLIGISKCCTYVFCRWDNLCDQVLPKPKSCVVWAKNNWGMGDLEHEHGRAWEACLFYPNDGHKFIKRIPDVLYADRVPQDKMVHPTEKPVSIIRQIIECNVGDVIFDPYMGSGTTLVAAKELGRKAIGIEYEEKYCRIAVERLRQEVLRFE